MATKKTTAEKPVEEVLTNAVIAGEKKVTITLPRVRGQKEDEGVFVSVNERTWLIKRGVPVEVPECVASVLHNAELMEEEAERFSASVEKS